MEKQTVPDAAWETWVAMEVIAPYRATAGSSETLVGVYQSTRRRVPQDINLSNVFRENLHLLRQPISILSIEFYTIKVVS